MLQVAVTTQKKNRPILLSMTHNPPGELSDQYPLAAGGISGQTSGDNMHANFVSPPNRTHEFVIVIVRVPALDHPTKGTVPGELDCPPRAAEPLLLKNGQDVSFAQSGLARGFATLEVVPCFVYLPISQHSHELVVFLAPE
jgi:hypothetical protein